MSERTDPSRKRVPPIAWLGAICSALLAGLLGCDILESPTLRANSVSPALQAARAMASVDSAKAYNDSLAALRKADSLRAVNARKTWQTDSAKDAKTLSSLATLRVKDSLAINKVRAADSILKYKHHITDSTKYAKDSIAGAKALAAVVASYEKKMAKDNAAYEKAVASGEARYAKNLAALEAAQNTKYEALIEKNEAAIVAAQDLIDAETSTTSDKVKAAHATKLSKAKAALEKTLATKEKAILAAQTKLTKDSLASETALAKLAAKMAQTPVLLAAKYTKDSLAIAMKLAKDVQNWTTRASDDSAKIAKDVAAKIVKWAKDTADIATAETARDAKQVADAALIAKADSVLVVRRGVVTFSPEGGSITEPVQVTLTSTYTSGTNGVIYYTTDGSTPTTESTPYTGDPIPVDSGMDIKAIAAQEGYANTSPVGVRFTLGTTDTAIFSIVAGTYTGAQSVHVSTTDEATIYYTLNGTTPTTSSASIASGGAISVDSSLTLKVLPVRRGKANAAVATAAYVIRAEPPIMSPATDSIAVNSMTISISKDDSLATIHYTMDGTTPTASSPILASGSTITLKAIRTIKAICTRYHFANSVVVTVNDTIQAATPTFSLGAGEIDTATASATISAATDGAVIYYSFDDTVPTPSAHLYSGAIRLHQQTTLRAIAVRPNMKNSEEASALYTIPMGVDTNAVIGSP